MIFSLFLVLLGPWACDGVSFVDITRWFHRYGTDKIDVEKAPPSHLRMHAGPQDVAHNITVPSYLEAMTERAESLPDKWLRLFTLGLSSDGKSAWNGKYFRLFLESARGSGADMVLVGDILPLGTVLPKNVVHLHITWDQIAFFVEKTYFNGEEQYNLRHPSSYKKACDLKPLIAMMLPKMIEGYKWWGWCDNDMWLGNLKKILPREMDEEADIWSGEYGRSHGPLTLLRNTPELNTMLLHGFNAEVVKHVMSRDAIYAFDEWGNGRFGGKTSFSWIIATADHNKELKMASHSFGPIMHDCLCKYVVERLDEREVRERKRDCSTPEYIGLDDVCAMTQDVSRSGDVTTTLHRTDGGEWLFCHFQCAKVYDEDYTEWLVPDLPQAADEYLGSKVVLFERHRGFWTQNELSFPLSAPFHTIHHPKSWA